MTAPREVRAWHEKVLVPLREERRILDALLDDEQIGIGSWWIALGDCLQRIADLRRVP